MNTKRRRRNPFAVANAIEDPAARPVPPASAMLMQDDPARPRPPASAMLMQDDPARPRPPASAMLMQDDPAARSMAVLDKFRANAGFQTRVLPDLRTPAEVAANVRSPCGIDGSPVANNAIEGVTCVGPDEDVELNATYRFRLEPDDGQPIEFIGALIAQAVVERGDNQRTWIGLYRTRGGKIISEIVRGDGRAHNVPPEMGDQFRAVKVFDTMDLALASIRSTALRNQLLSDLGLLKTRFID